MVNQNVESLRTAYRLWNETKGGTVDHWMSLLAEDVVFGSLANGSSCLAFTATCRGRDQVPAYFAGLLGEWAMDHYTVDEFVAEGDRVVAIGSTCWHNKRTGKAAATPKVDLWRFRNGKAVEFFEMYDSAALAAAAS